MQRVHVSTDKVIYDKRTIGWNTNIPQIDQGIEALRVKITPISKNSVIKVYGNLIGRREANISIAAMFKNHDNNAVYSTCNNGPNGWFVPLILDYEMKSNTTEEIVISVRISGYALNGRKNSSKVHNGVMTSSLTVEEYL